VDFYPIKQDTQQLSQFIGSAASRLGFYHVDIPDTHTDTSSVHNVRLVYTESGTISKEGLFQGLVSLCNTNWPLQIRDYWMIGIFWWNSYHTPGVWVTKLWPAQGGGLCQSASVEREPGQLSWVGRSLALVEGIKPQIVQMEDSDSVCNCILYPSRILLVWNVQKLLWGVVG
jgi:hypothetical protein